MCEVMLATQGVIVPMAGAKKDNLTNMRLDNKIGLKCDNPSPRSVLAGNHSRTSRHYAIKAVRIQERIKDIQVVAQDRPVDELDADIQTKGSPVE